MYQLSIFTGNVKDRLMNCNFLKRIIFSILLLALLPFSSHASKIDSIGVETIGGKVYVIHKVERGETLYSISKRYNASMNAIADATPEVKKGLKAGMTIRVPYNQQVSSVSPSGEKKTHTVVKGETLYGISRQYGVTYQQIMEWNELDDLSISIGQRLVIGGPIEPKPQTYYEEGKTVHIVQQGQGLYAVAREHGVTVEELMEWNNLENSNLALGQELVVKFGEVPSYVAPGRPQLTHKASQPRTKQYLFDKISENGLASMIEGTGDSKMYLALHRTAPIGTLIAVRNEMNDQMVFVRVVGTLPDTGVNSKLVIRISESAYNNIGAIDPKFRVELSYLPQLTN